MSKKTYSIEFSHEEKVLFPKSGITKGDVIAYYEKIAPYFITHAKGHCVVMQRFPNGIEEGFFQKEVPAYFPSWIPRKTIILKSGEPQTLVLVKKKEDVLYLANQAVITPHLWLSDARKPNFPNKIVFDLDPSQNNLLLLHKAARKIKKVLESYGLVPFIMTTGSRGYHVVAPLKPTHNFDTIHLFAHDIAQELATRNPKDFTITLNKAERGNRVFIDYLRNGFGATSVAPYAVRAQEGAPVGTPIQWKELKNTPPQKYTINNIFRRLARKGDAWKDFRECESTLSL